MESTTGRAQVQAQSEVVSELLTAEDGPAAVGQLSRWDEEAMLAAMPGTASLGVSSLHQTSAPEAGVQSRKKQALVSL